MKLLKIGRDMSNDIVLQSNRVSSLHAEITLLDNGDIQLEDKGSSNGTFVMNQPIKPGKVVNIRRGDAIRFADVELQWSQVPMPEDNSAYKGIYGIGSHFNNDIQISGATVSRYHATVKQAKDGKMYIVDHSKNGTTVDGVKISKDSLYRIKKNSAVVCGGVPVDLSRLPWKSSAGKTIGLIAAGVVLLAGITFGLIKLLNNGKSYSDSDLFSRFHASTVLIMPTYHYEISIGDLDMDQVNKYIGIPKKVFFTGESLPEDISALTKKNYVDIINELSENKGMGNGTGFFVSKDGKIVTNLHVVKPWLVNGSLQKLEQYYSGIFSKYVSTNDIMSMINRGTTTSLSSYISQLKVTAVLDEITIVPDGELFDADNKIKCRVLYANDEEKNIVFGRDVALIQTINKRLPSSDCTFVNITDSIDTNEEVYSVGEHVYILGYPSGVIGNEGAFLQSDANKTGIHCYGTGGSITSETTEFQFSFDAAIMHGSSGSPIFNSKGMLIGILNSGVVDTAQGFNRGIKSQYIKELLSKPHQY